MEGTRVSDSETVPPSPRACRECGVYEPEHGGIPARSMCVQPGHAEIQARMERGQRAGGRDDVSRGTILGLLRQIGRRTSRFALSLSF